MDKSETGSEKDKKTTKNKFGAFRRGLKLDRAPSPKIKSNEKDDKFFKSNKTYSLLKKLKLGKSVSNPTLGSPPVYLATEVERGTLENTPSISSVSTDAASSSGHTRSLHAEMSGSSATDALPTTDASTVATANSEDVATTTQPTVHDDEDDSYESFHESDSNQHEIERLSVDKSGVTGSSANVPPEDSDNLAGEMPAFSDLIYDKQQENAQTSNVTQFPQERREHLYKLLVIGELGTGKTSIIKRYVHQFFSQHYRATIGVDFALKVLNWDANTVIRLQLWDIAGQERFGNMTRVYYKDAVGAFIVFDATRVATFDAVVKWKQDLDSKVQLSDGSPIPCVLLGNKCDQQKEGMINIPSKMDEYCKEKGFAGWFETSAKENINIEEAAKFLVNKILLNDKLLCNRDVNKDTDRIAIDGKGGNNSKQKANNLKSTCTC